MEDATTRKTGSSITTEDVESRFARSGSRSSNFTRIWETGPVRSILWIESIPTKDTLRKTVDGRRDLHKITTEGTITESRRARLHSLSRSGRRRGDFLPELSVSAFGWGGIITGQYSLLCAEIKGTGPRNPLRHNLWQRLRQMYQLMPFRIL